VTSRTIDAPRQPAERDGRSGSTSARTVGKPVPNVPNIPAGRLVRSAVRARGPFWAISDGYVDSPPLAVAEGLDGERCSACGRVAPCGGAS
jgi:hypothetical protein